MCFRWCFQIEEEQNKALNEPVEIENDLDTTPVAEEQQVGGEGQDPDFADTQETPETGDDSKKGYSSRIRELNAAKKAAEDRANSLESKLAELTAPAQVYQQPTDFNEPIVKPGEEIDAQEFERRVLQRADAKAELRFRQAEAINRINSEAQAVITLYPELDPDSDSFNAELSDTIAEATEAYVKSNPYNASVKQFVNKMMKPYKGAVSKEVGKATENIAKQVSQAALRPNSIKQPEKTANEKSIAELEAELGVVNS